MSKEPWSVRCQDKVVHLEEELEKAMARIAKLEERLDEIAKAAFLNSLNDPNVPFGPVEPK